MKRLLCLGVMVLACSAAKAQEMPKPGPEHDVLKKMVGSWEIVMKTPQGDMKGSATFKMDLGGLWLNQRVEMDMGGGIKFEGQGMDTYSADKKKYIGVWFDSMMTDPMTMEGTFDKEKKTTTMTGDSKAFDGKMGKVTMTSTWNSDDSFTLKSFKGDGKEPLMTIEYKRKK